MPEAFSLNDKYAGESGRVFITGLQALVRLPIVQMRRDRAAGLNTAAFISGYRGSPLGGYDQELQRAEKFLRAHDIIAQPGINEDLAATAVWGSQQLHLSPGARKDGVVGMWYGKGPGVDRCGDVFKHANAAGSSKHGGVLCLAGDDHSCKSSSLPHQSDHAFMSALIPVLYPSSLHEFIELGLLGIAMSRYSGCWTGMKFISDTVEASAVVDLAGERRRFVLPDDFELPADGVHLRWPDPPVQQDERLQEIKGYAAVAFARANEVNKATLSPPRARIGIIASGKAYEDTRQALRYAGIGEEEAAAIGVRLYKVAMPWPLEPQGIRRFAEGVEELLIVEDRREMIENQVRQYLFDWPSDRRPRVVGKFDENGAPYFSHSSALTVASVSRGVVGRVLRLDFDETLKRRIAENSKRLDAGAAYNPPLVRQPYYCSGCPHNTSTRVPEGSLAMAGIGCHYMATWMPDRPTVTFSHMGGEGVPWISQAHFTDEKHRFVNLGDGTYFHSGILAVRQAVAAGVNITYKILYNDAVAMTGGQAVDGDLSPARLAWQLHHEGVKPIYLLAETPEEHRAADMPPGVVILPRAHIDRVMRLLRDTRGCSAIVYVQECAAQKRRKRKRGALDDPRRRVFIHPEVCEGCGDCSAASNCLSVEPLETPLGRKRKINQSTCNKDFSCLGGFCPSFIEISGGELKRRSALPPPQDLPPPRPPPSAKVWNIVIAGVGGTGVLTVGALLGMASHINGKAGMVLDMSGLAQKGGKVFSHVRLCGAPGEITDPQILAGSADVLLAADIVAATAADVIPLYHRERTRAVINTQFTPTAEFIHRPQTDFHLAEIHAALRARLTDEATFADFAAAAETAAGNSIAANILMLGFACQRGLLPLTPAAITAAIELNGVAVADNIAAFNWGRALAADESRFAALTPAAASAAAADSLDDIIALRQKHLTDYQDEKLARRYTDLLTRVRRAVDGGNLDEALTRAAAENYAALLAYKDEYEVARLLSDESFYDDLRRRFDGAPRIHFHLSPPLFAGRDVNGRPRKYRVGAWMLPVFRALRRWKKYRGTLLDPFARTAERKTERRLVGEYEKMIDDILPRLSPQNQAAALELLRLPAQMRGFGPVKAAAVRRAEERRRELLAAFAAA